MTIRYDIYPDLDFLVYIFMGECFAREYFDLYQSIYLTDNRRHHGMKILMDLSNAELMFDTPNLQEAISIMADNKNKGEPRDRVALLSNHSSIHFVTDTLKLVGDHLPMDLETFNAFSDAVQWLGLAEDENKAMLFWEEFKKGQNKLLNIKPTLINSPHRS